MQVPPKQQEPPPQVLPLQQAVPGAPQVAQKSVVGSHTRPALLQVPPEPMGEPAGGGQPPSPASPQRRQEFLMQLEPAAVQICPGQQGWPVPPQVPQAPAMH